MSLGVMALLVVLSVMSGFHEDIQKKILGVNSHIVAFSYTGKIADYITKTHEIEKIDGVKAAAPFLMGQVMVSHNKRSHGIYIRGVLPELEKNTLDIHNRMKRGSYDDITKKGDVPGIVLGNELAASLSAFLGDTVNIISPVGEMGPLGMLPRVKKFKVVGIFEIGMYEYDSNLAITSLSNLQDFMRFGNNVNALEIKLDEIYSAGRIKEQVANTLGPRYYARDWMEMNRNLFSALKLEKLMMFVILALIILVAAFNIVSTLIMNVMEKEREIAILKTMGATNNGIMSIFMIQGLLIGLTGTILGLLSGLFICYLLGTYEIIKLPADVYYLSHLPVKVQLSDFIAVCSCAIFISFLATIYPARQAAKLDPIEAIRYE